MKVLVVLAGLVLTVSSLPSQYGGGGGGGGYPGGGGGFGLSDFKYQSFVPSKKSYSKCNQLDIPYCSQKSDRVFGEKSLRFSVKINIIPNLLKKVLRNIEYLS